ncbi:MAG: cell division protein FtsX [Flavobacteriales bacterium Tduv]
MVGILGELLINARTISLHIKEQFPVEIFLKESISHEEIYVLIKAIESSKFVKTFQYIDKDKAMKIAQKELNIHDESLLERHIFPASIKMTLQADYTDPIHMDQIIKGMGDLTIVDEIKYPRDLLQEMHTNIEKWSVRLAGYSILFLIIAIILIHNAIKLSIHSKRFIIKSMQLVGAKRRAIYAPFLRISLWWGMIGGCIALITLTISGYYLLQVIHFPYKQDYYALSVLASGILLLGMIIASSSSYLTVRKYFRSTSDELHYS